MEVSKAMMAILHEFQALSSIKLSHIEIKNTAETSAVADCKETAVKVR
jgi:hypothetical protein